jgi:energy-coupling factor transporter ATP-binding protein EcfA2
VTIELTSATYRYAGSMRPALANVDLAVPPGEVTGLAGANEAGKSTLCLVASGLAPVAIGGRLEGSARLDGAETQSLKPHELAQRCGIVFQNSATQLTGTVPTVYEEIAFGLRNLGLPVGEIAERTSAALDALGIGELAWRDPLHLSGGQAQLVATATILALRPQHLVLDEPTSQLDPQGTRLVADALVALARQSGGALLLVEHKADLLARLARDVVLLDHGGVLGSGPARAMLQDPKLEAAGVAPPSPVRLARRMVATDIHLDRPLLEALGLDAPPPSDAGAQPSGSSAVAEVVRSAASEPVAIELDDVVFDYPGPVRALDGVSLRIEPGERVAIIGQNGSGKSTLVRQLNGLLRPSRGVVRIGSREIRNVHVAELARQVGLAFQDPDRQIFAGRVRSEVEFGPRNLGVHGAQLEETVTASLDAVGLGAERDTHPYDLGYSRRKLLSLASIVALRSPILVLDEPTTGQDSRGVHMIEGLVGSLSAAGRTVIAITHDMGFAAENFGRIVVMRAGRVILDGPPSEVFAAPSWPALASTYLEPPLAAVVGDRLGLGTTPTDTELVDTLKARWAQ